MTTAITALAAAAFVATAPPPSPAPEAPPKALVECRPSLEGIGSVTLTVGDVEYVVKIACGRRA
jgi:hypothetical protein